MHQVSHCGLRNRINPVDWTNVSQPVVRRLLHLPTCAKYSQRHIISTYFTTAENKYHFAILFFVFRFSFTFRDQLV